MTQAASPAVPVPISVKLFGVFQLTIAGQEAPAVRARAAGWILALLILRQGQEVERHWLAETLWPATEKAVALFILRRNLSELRKVLGGEAHRVHSPTSHTLRFDLTDVVCALTAFERFTSRKDTASLQQAVTLYRGELLEGCREEWILAERAVYEQVYLKALEDLARNERQNGNLDAATQWFRRLIAQAPLHEEAHYRLIETLGLLKDYVGIERQYRELRRHLLDGLVNKSLVVYETPSGQNRFKGSL